MPIKKAKFGGAYAEWWVDCPYCNTSQEGYDDEKTQKCEECHKAFIVPEEVGDISVI